MVDFGRDGKRVQRFRPACVGFYDGDVAADALIVGGATAQVVTFDSDTTLDQAAYVWTLKINSSTFTFTSDATPTQTEIATGLKAAVNAGSEPVTATGTTTCIVTADVPGQPFTWEDLTSTDSTAVPTTVLTTPNAADGVKAPVSGKLSEIALTARVAPTGADIIVYVGNITKGLWVTATLPDGDTFARDTGADIAVSVGDILYAVITQVGSGTAGAGLQVTPYIEVDL
jgi:hypothetical protein